MHVHLSMYFPYGIFCTSGFMMPYKICAQRLLGAEYGGLVAAAQSRFIPGLCIRFKIVCRYNKINMFSASRLHISWLIMTQGQILTLNSYMVHVVSAIWDRIPRPLWAWHYIGTHSSIARAAINTSPLGGTSTCAICLKRTYGWHRIFFALLHWPRSEGRPMNQSKLALQNTMEFSTRWGNMT